MTAHKSDLNKTDWEFCRPYLQKLQRAGLAPHEPWELELEVWGTIKGGFRDNRRLEGSARDSSNTRDLCLFKNQPLTYCYIFP